GRPARRRRRRVVGGGGAGRGVTGSDSVGPFGVWDSARV
ncbi:MAG: hypothetical protein AVDCRST_MAG54-88, partial [uncultured Actinomycetospora sp.]